MEGKNFDAEAKTGEEDPSWVSPSKTAVDAFKEEIAEKSQSRCQITSHRPPLMFTGTGQSLEARMGGKNLDAEAKTGEEDPLLGVTLQNRS